jgi:hypothetical protein
MRKLVQPRALLKAQTTPIVSPQDLETLIETKYENPVTSLYLSLNPEKVAPAEKGLLRSFHSLKTGALEESKDFIEALPRAEKQNLTQDLEEIEAFLAESVVPSNMRSLAIFKSGERLNRVMRLPVRVADRLVIDTDPHILPLEAVLEDNPKTLLVEVSKEESRFLNYRLGLVEEAGRIHSFVPSDTVDASIPGGVQRHRLTHLEWHLKATAPRTLHLCTQLTSEVLVLMAEKRVMSQFEEFLAETLKGKIIGRIHNTPAAETRDRQGLIESALRDHKVEVEAMTIEELSAYRPDEEFVYGLRQVLTAWNSFLVRKLLVAQSLSHKGFVCGQHHYISLEAGDCPVCGARVLPAENVIDEMIEMARLHRVQTAIVEYREDLLAGYDGIAAMLHYRMDRTQLIAG